MNPPYAKSKTRRVVHSDQHNAADTHLHGAILVFARICWLALAALALTVFVTALPLYFASLQKVCHSYPCASGQLLLQSAQVLQNVGISVGGYAVFVFVLTLALTMVWFLVGGVIFWRKSDDRIALLVSLALVLFAGSGGLSGLVSSTSAWIGFVTFCAHITFILIFFLFPDGRFAPRWMVLLAILWTLFLVDVDILPLFIPNSPLFPWNWPSPLIILVIIGLIGGLAFSQLYRYLRISNPLQHQRTKWVVFAFIVVLVGFIGEILVIEVLPQIVPALHPPDPLYQSINYFVYNLSPVLIPLSFGISMLRSRLWDIDIIINRTLVYGTLTVSLTLVYVGLVIGLQALVRLFTGQAVQSPVVIVASTLAIAALFQPLRRRIQAIIDRRFYRRKYDAAKIVAAFSATLRNEVDLSQLSEQLIVVIEETMQPTHISLWLRPPEQSRQQNTGLLPRIDEEERVPP